MMHVDDIDIYATYKNTKNLPSVVCVFFSFIDIIFIYLFMKQTLLLFIAMMDNISQTNQTIEKTASTVIHHKNMKCVLQWIKWYSNEIISTSVYYNKMMLNCKCIVLIF